MFARAQFHSSASTNVSLFRFQSTEPTVIQRKRQLLSSASPTLLAGYDAVLHNSPMEIDSLDDYESSGAGSLRPMKIRRTQSCSSSQPPVERGNSQAVNAHIYGHEACLLPWFPGESDSHKRINGQTVRIGNIVAAGVATIEHVRNF